MSSEGFLELAFPPYASERDVDFPLGHDQAESTVEGLRVRSRIENPLGFLEFGLIDSDVLVTQG
jgi:hypothetical protein